MDDLEQRKAASALQVLFKAARLVNEEAIRRCRIAADDDRIRVSHTTLFPHVTFEGVRLTALADTLGVSKQAVQQLVDELEEMEVFERIPDPDDRRAKLIRWTERGRAAIGYGLGILGDLEDELASVVGGQELAAAHATLLEIVGHLERNGSGE